MSYTDGLDKPDEYFNTVLYTGDGTSDRTITTPFSPEFTWIKMRSGADDNVLYDIVRQTSSGVGIRLKSNTTEAESDLGDYVNLVSNGFKVDGGTYNNSGFTFASWNWLANGAGVSNTDGTITSTVSANTTAGFSIVSYTGNSTSGATVGHGLGVAPKVVFGKARNTAGEDWFFGTSSIGFTKFLKLNTTDAENTFSGAFNNTAPSSTVVTLGNNGIVNSSSFNYIMYCFAEKKGFSKAFSYTGNGSADGSFLYLGFRPSWLLIKRTDSAGYDWLVYDNKRQVSFNVVDDFLNPNLSSAETTGNANQSLDFLSNGVKFRGSGASSNASGGTYIGIAFAEHPFVTSTSVPTTAR